MPNINNQKSEWEEKELGALWQKQKQGTTDTYYSGKINLKSVGFDKDINVVVFPNRNKTSDNQPDLKIYVSKPANTNVSQNKTAPVKRTTNTVTSNTETRQTTPVVKSPVQTEQQDDGTLF